MTKLLLGHPGVTTVGFQERGKQILYFPFLRTCDRSNRPTKLCSQQIRKDTVSFNFLCHQTPWWHACHTKEKKFQCSHAPVMLQEKACLQQACTSSPPTHTRQNCQVSTISVGEWGLCRRKFHQICQAGSGDCRSNLFMVFVARTSVFYPEDRFAKARRRCLSKKLFDRTPLQGPPKALSIEIHTTK